MISFVHDRLEQCLGDLTRSVVTETSNSIDSLEALKQLSTEMFLTRNPCEDIQCEKVLQLINLWVSIAITSFMNIIERVS